jgi:hypothetical protein
MYICCLKMAIQIRLSSCQSATNERLQPGKMGKLCYPTCPDRAESADRVKRASVRREHHEVQGTGKKCNNLSRFFIEKEGYNLPL